MTDTSMWMADQVVYQIFPERFAIGQPHTSATKLALPEYQDHEYKRRNWEELLEIPPRGKDFFGGDLRGIIDHLDYIQDLGATALYLTPIFSAPSNHKYDTTDFFTLDPQFGSEDTLRELIHELHHRHMRLVLDAVFNHVSNIHPWFLRAKGGEQPYRAFFTWREGDYYECWRDYRHMPELDLSNQALQELLFRGEASVMQKYLAMGVDGWRFDTAADLGLRTVHEIRQALRDKFPVTVLLGEVMGFGGEWCNHDAVYHGVMNYYFRDAVLSWLQGTVSARQVNYAVEEYCGGYGQAGALQSWSMLSSHDTPRLRRTIPDTAQRRLALVAQFTLPGVPLIYYGEENGMDGGDDPDCRRPMIWDENRWDHETHAFYQRLIAMRQSHRALRRGNTIVLGQKLDTNALVFLRHTEQLTETALVVINNAEHPFQQVVFTPYSHLYHALPMKNLLDTEQVIRMEAGNIRLNVPARTAAIFVPDDSTYTTYQFFKARNL